MIDKIKSIVRDYSDDAIINNPAVPNDKNEKAIDVTANSLVDHLRSEVRQGNTNSLVEILKKQDDPALNPTVDRVSTGVAGDLVKNLGIDNGAALGIVNKLIPPIISKLRSKANDPNESEFNIHGLLSSFGKGGGMMDSVKNIFGKQ